MSWWSETAGTDLPPLRRALPASAWTSPDTLIAAIDAGLSRDPREAERIRGWCRRGHALAAEGMDEVADLLDRIPSGDGASRGHRLVRYRLATRLIEPLREVAERAWTHVS